MSRTLVTGASGFIGRWATAELAALGHDVHALTRRSAPLPARKGVTWHTVDVLDAPSVGRLVANLRAERLLHLAWVTQHRVFWESPDNARWLDASKELVARFAESGGFRVVSAGTCAEYDWGDARLADEDCSELATPTAPSTPYGLAKLELQRWLAVRSMRWAVGRVFFTYGELEHPDRLVPSVARAVLAGERARTGPGGIVRDFLHVADVGAAFAALVDEDVQGPVNVASGLGTSIAELATTIAELAGTPGAVDVGALPGRPNEPPRLVASAARLKCEVGFLPSLSLLAGLKRAVAWWAAEKISSSGSPDACILPKIRL